jgi:hypothetical protein
VTVLLLAACACLTVFLVRQVIDTRRAKEKSVNLERELSELRAAYGQVSQRVQELARYEGIPDVERHLAEQRAAAEQWYAEMQRRGQAIVDDAQSKAGERARQAEAHERDTQARALAIIAEAERRARETAGDALDARANAKQYEELARAMENVVAGYGDRYLVPTFALLDELGEEFGFEEAGQKLTETRGRVRNAIRRGDAAACDYAEPNRRTTAIHFVLDAFNGKCDMVLADVRHDNVGTLKQKVKDAFNLVNLNGQAFRNARIVPAYLALRLEELEWASAVHALKLKQREEQRELKERLRDEERARRDFAKQLREAEKEEQTLRQAMAKAQAEIAKASDAQRAKYEARLAELTVLLQQAEAKGQRALSMAQQTKAGNVYIISNTGSFGEHVYKIGLTRRLDPFERVRELGDASVPFEFDVHAMIRADDAPALERELQRRFLRNQVNKVNPRKEFFRVSLQDIRAMAESMGCHTSWTMAATARDYKETQVIEQRMGSQTFEQEWVRQQMKDRDAVIEVSDDDLTELAS